LHVTLHRAQLSITERLQMATEERQVVAMW
jgi:hypothetical protein